MNSMTVAHPRVIESYRRRVGAVAVTALLDGYVELSNAVWQGVEPEQIDALQAFRGLPPGGARNGITAHLIDTGHKRIMIDAGAAGLFGPHSSAFPTNLVSAGVTPDDIDEVLITHMHPDHIGALLTHGKPTLPNAVLRPSATDLAFWTSADEQARAPEFMRSWFQVARDVVAAYGKKVAPVADGEDLGGGISALAMPGHTPGHTGFMIESEGKSLLVWGDTAVSAAIQFPHPKANMIFDIDRQTGLATRLRAFDRATADRQLVAGTHLPFPTFGYVVRRGDAYEWIAEEWRYDIAESPLQPVI